MSDQPKKLNRRSFLTGFTVASAGAAVSVSSRSTIRLMASNHASCIQNGAISPCWSVQSGLRTRRGFFHVSTESTSPSAWMEKTGSAFGWPFFLPCVSVGLRSSQTPCTVLFSSSMKRSGMVFKSSAVIAFASSNCFLASASFFRGFWAQIDDVCHRGPHEAI